MITMLKALMKKKGQHARTDEICKQRMETLRKNQK